MKEDPVPDSNKKDEEEDGGSDSEPSASSSFMQPCLRDAPNFAFPSSAAKPAVGPVEASTPSGATKPAAAGILKLDDILPTLQGRESEPLLQKLLEDVPKLREWQRATRPTNPVREAMMKLGARWQVPQETKKTEPRQNKDRTRTEQ